MRLLIRSEQMTAIEDAAEEKFARRIADHLLRQYANSVVTLPDSKSTVAELPEETLDTLVRNSIEYARGYGLNQESSIAAFSALRFEVAPNFDKHNLSRLILGDESFEPNARIDQLLEILTEKNWETIQKTYDPEAWFFKPEVPQTDEPKAEEEK